MVRLVLLLLVFLACAAAQQAEVERLDSLIEELTVLKGQAAAVEAKIDALLRVLSEQRGAIQNKPAYNAIKSVEADVKPDVKKPVARCAALTESGKRCTRAALEGGRYCRQHQLAHQK